MKVRNDYVSNSSSSSYIVIANDGETTKLDKYVNGHPLDQWYSAYEFPNTMGAY